MNGSWGKHREAFLQDGKARRLRATTMAEYTTSLDRFFKFLGDRPLDRGAVTDWTVAMQEEGLADRTITKHLRGLRVFVRFAAAETGEQPLKIRMPIVRQERERPALTQEQIERVDAHLNEHYPLAGRRGDKVRHLQYHLRFWFPLEVGLRIREGLAVRWNDIDLGRGTVYLAAAKTKNDRHAALTTVWGRLVELLGRVERQEGYLLYPLFGENKRISLTPGARPLTYQGYRRYLDTLNGQVKLEIEFHAHDLRRTCITQMILAGAPIPVVAGQVGHLRWSTTQIYDKSTADQRVELLLKMMQQVSK